MLRSKDASRIVPYFVLSHLRFTPVGAKHVPPAHSTLASYKSRKIHRNRHQVIAPGEAQRAGLNRKIITSKIESIRHSV